MRIKYSVLLAVVALGHPPRFAVHIPSEGQMASTGKRKTTFAKLDRERRLREKRAEKKLKKDQRRRAAAEAAADPIAPVGEDG